MATDKDLLEKADALLRRHALAPGSETGTYPVLTDLVMPPDAAQPATPEPPATPPQDPGLRDEIVEGVLAELRTRLGADLEREVAESLAPRLRAAVKEALATLEDRLAAMVTDAVARALQERPPVK
jgi:hypothetical protein